MPVSQRPGSDSGSPLYAKIKIHLSNSGDKVARLRFATVVYDQESQSHPIVFQVLPDQHNSVWDGSLGAKESRVIELLTNDGPYLPVSSRIYTVIVFTDQDGNSQSVGTARIAIDRTE